MDDEGSLKFVYTQSQRLSRIIWKPGASRSSLSLLTFCTKILRGMQLPTEPNGIHILVSVYDPGKLLRSILFRPKLLLHGLWRCVIRWEQVGMPVNVAVVGPVVRRPRMLLQGLEVASQGRRQHSKVQNSRGRV